MIHGFSSRKRGDGGIESSVPSALLRQSPHFHLARSHNQTPDFPAHSQEQRTGGQSTVCIHKRGREAKGSKACKTRFPTVKVTTFPFTSLKSISYTFDLYFLIRETTHIVNTQEVLFLFFLKFFPSINCLWGCCLLDGSVLPPLKGLETPFRAK